MDDWHSFDDDYVRRLREGDPQTTGHFFRYFDRILTIKMRKKLRPDVVEDGKSIVFSRVLQAVNEGKVRNGEAFGSYVCSFAHHVTQELLRTDPRTDQLDDQHLDIPSAHSADELLIDHETQRRVQEALSKMSDRDRELLERYFIWGDTYLELCARFKVTSQYLRVRIHRAKKYFMSFYETDPPKKT